MDLFVLDLQATVSDYILFVVYQVEKNNKKRNGMARKKNKQEIEKKEKVFYFKHS